MYTVIDPVAIVFYAAVCAGLAAVSPAASDRGRRLAIGAVVGIVAALILPNLRQLVGL
ncbi:hypothetical protein [Jannaschia donghaensis]|uniref:Uncharacterized protein n=1 Tax=Jannaschia donghaensis TaxID=420998 RepID=A0A0M6YGC0_9RHOB|nr:hypothetical protein [Jannaschia donghaensis]CTQ48725.1 hypothetical protein JDO7802_00730 [Jannaschia donghaensis]